MHRPATHDRPSSTPRLVVGRIELSFRWSLDRWSHAFRLLAGESPTEWHSVEGPRAASADPSWPASPPITEIASVGTGAIVGVGRAGRSHFSVSFTADPDAADSVLVECACRVQGVAGWLGSTYLGGDLGGDGNLELAARPGEADGGPQGARTIFWAYRVGPAGPRLREGG